MDVLDRIRKLLPLATSSDSEEARTAAHKVCGLLVEHQVLMSVPTPLAPPVPVPFPTIQWAARQTYTPPEPRPAPTPIKRGGLWFYGYKEISSKYEGYCGECNNRYFIGDDIRWKKNSPTYCLMCYDRLLKESREQV